MLNARSTPLLALWAIAFWGSLQIGRLPGDWGHGICGPWGCGPPLQALVAYHLAWLVLIAPVAVVICRADWATRSVRTWMSLSTLATGIALIVGTALYQLLVWLPEAGDAMRVYYWHRCAFVVATTIDVPITQLLLVGTASSLACLRWRDPAQHQ